MWDQCLADSLTPVRRVDGDGIEFPELRIDRVPAGADAGKPNDGTLMLRDPPTVRNGLCKIMTPPPDKVRGYCSVSLRH